ncbi:MAG: cytochrome b/b6 domain-containing protein [Pseudobdellovibrionaceae bacterium]
MRTTKVYDLPLRLFHWLFAGFFVVSFIIGKTVDDDSVIFSYHMISGILLTGLVIWRLAWGFLGSHHSRFFNFPLNLLELKDYFYGILSGSRRKWAGHNPASSWASIAMFALALGLGTTGYLMTSNQGNSFDMEDIHELLAHGFLVVVILHVAGIALHTLRHKDGIAFSMIDGKKSEVDMTPAIPSPRPVAAVVLLGLVLSSAVYLFSQFDSQTRALNLMGTTLQLGESENENENTGADSQMSDTTEPKETENDDD